MMKIYTQYISNYAQSLETLRELEHNNIKFREWKQGVEHELGGKRLPSYLIMPVQRIPRYVLLLAVCIYFKLANISKTKISRICGNTLGKLILIMKIYIKQH